MLLADWDKLAPLISWHMLLINLTINIYYQYSVCSVFLMGVGKMTSNHTINY